MRSAGRAAAAIEIIDEVLTRGRPASEALRDWGKSHRFAGAADRSAIGNLVYDVLRHRSSMAAAMSEDAPRALVLASLRFHWRRSIEELDDMCRDAHGPAPLTDAERAKLASEPVEERPHWIAGDYPEWLDASLARAFADERVAEGRALSDRAPLDLRANLLKATPEKVQAALEKFGAVRGRLVPTCVRIEPPPMDGRTPNVEAEPAHGKGWFEVQDQGSQAAALLCGAREGQQVADICAGGGGKTLALAAAMTNKGQIFAYDSDRHRLRPIFERLTRAGARNVQVAPADEPERLSALEARMDVVLVDAPCSGSGAWRRKPDAKWRLKPEALARRMAEQAGVLDSGAKLVRPGGRLVYVTCSVLPEENGDQVRAFLNRNSGFELVPYANTWTSAIGTEVPVSADQGTGSLLLTPRRHGTDGFFVAILSRRA